MTNAEAIELIAYTGQKWGAAADLPGDPKLMALRAQVWVDALADYPAAAVRSVLAMAEDEFPPNVMVIRRRIEDASGQTPSIPAWDDYWRWVRKMAAMGSLFLLDDKPEFVCPWPEFATLMTLADFAELARDELGEGDLEMIHQAHVRRRYESRVETVKREGLSRPPIVQALDEQRRQVPATIGHNVRELDEGDDEATGA